MKEAKDLLWTTTNFSVFLFFKKRNQNMYYADVKNLCVF